MVTTESGPFGRRFRLLETLRQFAADLAASFLIPIAMELYWRGRSELIQWASASSPSPAWLTTPEPIDAKMDALFEAFANKDGDQLRALCADDYHGRQNGSPPLGFDEMVAMLTVQIVGSFGNFGQQVVTLRSVLG